MRMAMLVLLIAPLSLRAETDSEKVQRLEKAVEELKAEVENLKKQVQELKGTKSAAEAKPEVVEKKIFKITPSGQKIRMSDGTLWNFGEDSKQIAKWKVGDDVKMVGKPENGYQKFEGPDGNTAKAKEEK